MLVELVIIILMRNKFFWVICVNLKKLFFILLVRCLIFCVSFCFEERFNFFSEFVVLLKDFMYCMLGFIIYFNMVFLVWISVIFVFFIIVGDIFFWVWVLFRVVLSVVIFERVFFVIKLFCFECVLIIWVKFCW